MKRNSDVILSLIIIVTIVTIIFIMIFTNPLNKSEEKIEEYILTLMPLGTSLEDVIAVIKSNEKWKVLYRSWEPWPSDDEDAYLNATVYQGGAIRVLLGRHKFLWNVGLILFFDKNDFVLNSVEVRISLAV